MVLTEQFPRTGSRAVRAHAWTRALRACRGTGGEERKMLTWIISNISMWRGFNLFMLFCIPQIP